ncbi:putative retinol dehydrogenase protein [Neofusicoccum parvum UCRNP2]|uniref:Putative retinol dehydrogenase protein n=1 Tax=Botryosphaeria parva (strain UCR-NP2) TaxID=1287680 RepID=R1H2I9_BOTPV|nr:putative retinol dehydrogenase protein [Neofusicoccum parvum UCRNP2]
MIVASGYNRSRQKRIDEVITSITSIKPNANVKSVLVDLVSQASVRQAADEIKALTPHIDVLINNAGFTVYKRQTSPEGIESQLAGNHIGPFLLTNLLLDHLVAGAEASQQPGMTRIINLSSIGHRFSPFRFHDYNTEGKPVPPEEQSDRLSAFPPVLSKPVDGYVGFQAYNQSKTANVLFTVELNKRLNAKGIVSYSVHPGKILEAFYEMMPKLNPKPSIREGASTTLVAAFDPNLDDFKGYYLSDCQLEEAEPWATDPKVAERLWALSEELVKQNF